VTPSDWLVRYGRLYPLAWRDADDFRRARGGTMPDWPVWCFLPKAGWAGIVSSQHGVRTPDGQTVFDSQFALGDCPERAHGGRLSCCLGVFEHDA
jgi:hypothetical protein